MSIQAQLSKPSLSGAYTTGIYRNLFLECGKSPQAIKEKLDHTFNQLFYGNDSTQRVFYPVGSDRAYIYDTYDKDVRSEGLSYGMMICVQMNKKAEFDKLWTYAKTVTQHQEGARKGYFGWSANPITHKLNDVNSAPDGEEYYVMALFFAAHRWGNGQGIYNYEAEANQLLHDMIYKEKDNGGVVDGVVNMFNREHKMVVFVPLQDLAFSDPSYHLPAFYQLWATWAAQDKAFWQTVADTSRRYLVKAMHPTTGLATEYMSFDAQPQVTTFNKNSDKFSGDSWRVVMNVAMDVHWFGSQPAYENRINALLAFISPKGETYGSQYFQHGAPLENNYEGEGFYAMNAVAALATTNADAAKFVEKLWQMPVPSGTYRYYNGLLYMLGLLNVAGEYRIY